MTGAEFEGVAFEGVDLDLLADFVGGALDGTPDEERVATLVAEDPAWQAAFEALAPAMAAVGGALAAFEPEPMPDDLAARLDGLLREPETETAAAPAVPTNVVDLEARRRARRWAAPLAVAAAVIAFAGFGATWWVANQPLADQASSDSAAATAERATGVGLPFTVTSSGIDYSAATLADVPMSATMATGEDQAGSLPEAPKSATLGRLDDTGALLACIEAITAENAGGTLSVESVDYARFDGKPAVIVRFSAANGQWVWAVGPECGSPGAGADAAQKLPVR
ncbi:hypothetical protein [Actinoplanes sp. G11-F43]|uniref:hypothetical protein n=1 Tax=Actinoplanes sp. G11-F43 TaxID=3424130 RepID=UPI003D32969F